MKIFVTGGNGFLGTSLCARLRAVGHDVTAPRSRQADLRDARSLAAWEGVPFDQIYHLAAWTQAGDFCLHHPGEQWIVNQQINTNVLAWWQQRQPQAKLIAIGTSCAYAPAAALVEENYLQGLPIDSLFAYAMTKRMLYAGLLALRQQFGLTYLQLVPSTLYGPNYHTDARQLHFVFDVIRKIIHGKLYGEPVVLWGDGHQKREVILVDDFVRLASRLADEVSNENVNIGAGEEFSIRHFARLICDEVGYDFARIEFDTTRYVGATSKLLGTAKLRRLLGEEAAVTPLAEGLPRVVHWMLEQCARGQAATTADYSV
jgi:GDP-L-fucose synthase